MIEINLLPGQKRKRRPGAGFSMPDLGELAKSIKDPLLIGAVMSWVVAGALEFSGPSRLLFGTDYPVEPHETTTRSIPSLGLPPDVLYALDRGNAERLFPRFRS